MALLFVGGLTKYYGADLIFEDISVQVARGEKVAVVGANGAGKSTFLKIVGGLLEADGGTVTIERANRVAYLAQEVRFPDDLTLWQAMEQAFEYLCALQAELRDLEARMGDTHAPQLEAAMERYGDLLARFEHAGGYQMDQRIERMLQGLGFHETQYAQPLRQFSGGQKTRAGLAATLLSDPDLLLLDEPTNHLDLETLEWLEGFLKTWHGTLLVISHDRYFLDKVTGRTLEVIDKGLEDYPASYNGYLELKAERLERRLKEYEAQQEYIAKTEEFIQRYKAGQRSKEARGREKRLNRLKETQMLERPKEAGKLKLFLDGQLRSGDIVLSFDDLVVGYHPADPRSPARVLVQAHGREMLRGERVALLGPNGCGKTTLLRTLIGQQHALKGSFRLGHNVNISYYAQGHDTLRMDATVLDEVLRVNAALGEERARTLLGRFLFSGDDVFKQVSELSGGERSRVALAQLTQLPGNLLLLDEPTNHLDIAAREALEGVLKEYPGSILFVSHDRYFIDALADKLWIVKNGHLTEYLGTYNQYMEHLEAQRQAAEQAQQATAQVAPNTKNNGKPARPVQEDRQRKKQLAALEAEVAKLEQELARIQTELEQAAVAQDIERITKLGQQYTELETLLNQRYEDWTHLAA
ncbi:MAG: ABC-F family ATP-binding cassette domain-containing protein [Chloroflexaceae bacterium]|nr:ABC-F family ATP-binding cassette domain-containing protein [Chloroflexaceae bacterium]